MRGTVSQPVNAYVECSGADLNSSVLLFMKEESRGGRVTSPTATKLMVVSRNYQSRLTFRG
jgi:hypothetical protein